MLMLLLAVTAIVADAAKTDYGKLHTADCGKILFTGRTKTIDGGAVTYDWVGVYFRTQFTGTSVAMRLGSTKTCYYNIFIDGKLTKKLQDTISVAHNVTLAEGLKSGRHTLRVQKATEGGQGATTIYGLFTDRGATLESVQPKDRYIMVWGDSYTCGYGTEAATAREPFSVHTENCDKAYGCIVARYFDADYCLTAHSGFGLVRNYGSKDPVTKESMTVRQWQTFDELGTETYTDTSRNPDIVMINLGTNDFSRNNNPKENQFVNAYIEFIESIRSRYADVPIICIVPHSACQYLRTCMRMLKERTALLGGIEVVGFTDDIVTVAFDTGSGHPNYSGHKKIAMTLIPVVSKLTGWRMEDRVVK